MARDTGIYLYNMYNGLKLWHEETFALKIIITLDRRIWADMTIHGLQYGCDPLPTKLRNHI